MSSPKPLVIADLRGGRNGADPPISLPETQAVELLNVDHFDGLIGRKRGGSDNVAITGGTAFSGGIQALMRHVPGSDDTAAELWAVDGAPIVKRLTGGTSWANITLDDAIQATPQTVMGVSLNGKLFLAYDSAVDRLHCYDPSLSSPRVRRVGIAAPAAPTCADSAAGGGYAAVLRYYRVRWTQLNGSVVVRKSEPSASVSFTPDGSHAASHITRPTAAGEGETHWIVEASLDNASFFELSTVILATTTYDDSAGTTTYSGLTPSSIAGTFTVPTSAKALLTDGNRLLLLGNYEGGKGSRIYYTPVLGSLDKGDDERIVSTVFQSNWIDINENDGGPGTALGGPLYGVPYAFKYRQIYKLNPTGSNVFPYLPRRLSDTIGSIGQKTVITAKDAAGNVALYFLSADGPCRLIVGQGGAGVQIQYLGRDIEDIWGTINLSASTVCAWGTYFPLLHQVWWFIATGSSADPDTKIVFDVILGKFTEGERVRGGWYKHTGSQAAARCGVLFSNTLGASMSRDLKPYIGRASGTAIWKCETSAQDDAGTNFQAYAITKPLAIAPLGLNVGVGQTRILAKAGAATLTQTLIRDYGLETRTATVTTNPVGSETRVLKQIEGSDLSQAGTVQVQIGDGSALASAWTIDALSLPMKLEDPR